MKKILLSDNENGFKYYKVNLHCHSTLSDGKKTPEELKKYYMNRGYSAIAYTDHDVFITHNDLTDDKFVALNGFEFEIVMEDNSKTCHLCYVALDKNNKKSICYHRTKYLVNHNEQNRHLLTYDENKPDYERVYSPECINDMIEKGRQNGFFVTYNHPTWSEEEYPQYMSYYGMNAMEMVNYGCIAEGYDEYNGRVYNDMLNGGKRIYCVATDDNHNWAEEACDDSFGGYIMISAKELTYESLIDSMLCGRFFSATGSHTMDGPVIEYLAYEDGKVYIKTSPVKRINLICSKRVNISKYDICGGTVDSAEFPIRNNSEWFRIECIDASGHTAYTNAYFVDELDKCTEE